MEANSSREQPKLETPRKGIKALRGQPILYNELKKSFNLSVTPTGKHGFQRLAKERQISCSELIELIGRGLVKLSD